MMSGASSASPSRSAAIPGCRRSRGRPSRRRHTAAARRPARRRRSPATASRSRAAARAADAANRSPAVRASRPRRAARSAGWPGERQLPKHRRTGRSVSSAAVARPGLGKRERHEVRRIDRRADVLDTARPIARCAATGAKMSRPWNVATPIVRQPSARGSRGRCDRDDAAEPLRRRHEQAVVGADQDVAARGRIAIGQALGADAGVDDRQVHADRHVRQRRPERAGAARGSRTARTCRG